MIGFTAYLNNYFENKNKASMEYPHINVVNYNADYVNHIHEEPEILYVLEGEIKILIDMDIYLLHTGDICIITPGQLHNLFACGHNKTCIFKLYPFLDLSGLKLHSNILSHDAEFYVPIQKLLESMIHENSHQELGYQSAVSIASWQLQLYILRNIRHTPITNQEKKKIQQKIKLFYDVNVYLEESASETVSLESAALYCGYTKYYFSHYFKGTFGMGFWDYYSYFRIKKAVFMLENSENPITQIAQDSGFENLRSFHRLFQKTYHCTPKEYRNKL